MGTPLDGSHQSLTTPLRRPLIALMLIRTSDFRTSDFRTSGYFSILRRLKVSFGKTNYRRLMDCQLDLVVTHVYVQYVTWIRERSNMNMRFNNESNVNLHYKIWYSLYRGALQIHEPDCSPDHWERAASSIISAGDALALSDPLAKLILTAGSRECQFRMLAIAWDTSPCRWSDMKHWFRRRFRRYIL